MSSPATLLDTDSPTDVSGLPLLRDGDRLTADEFLRRYERMPNVKKAELVEGIVLMASPVSRTHAKQHTRIGYWLTTYQLATEGVESLDNATVLLDKDNTFQPDVTLATLPECGGRTKIDPTTYLDGGPELVAEVAVSTTRPDAGRKRRVYERLGAVEYILWRVYDEAIDWWTLRDGQYVAVEPDPADGLLKSVVYPGLWLDKAAMLHGDMPAVLAALQLGLASPGHAEFATRLVAAGI